MLWRRSAETDLAGAAAIRRHSPGLQEQGEFLARERPPHAAAIEFDVHLGKMQQWVVVNASIADEPPGEHLDRPQVVVVAANAHAFLPEAGQIGLDAPCCELVNWLALASRWRVVFR